MYEINHLDAKLLKCIKNNDWMALSRIDKKMHKKCQARIHLLMENGIIELKPVNPEWMPSATGGNMLVIPAENDYRLSEQGRVALENHLDKNFRSSREKWVERLWTFLSGIAVGVLSTLLIQHLQ